MHVSGKFEKCKDIPMTDTLTEQFQVPTVKDGYLGSQTKTDRSIERAIEQLGVWEYSKFYEGNV